MIRRRARLERQLADARSDNATLAATVQRLLARLEDAGAEIARLTRETEAEAVRADALGVALELEHEACRHLRRQVDALDHYGRLTPAEVTRLLSDAQHWRDHLAAGDGEPVEIVEAEA